MEKGTAQSAQNVFTGHGTVMDYVGLAMWFSPIAEKPGGKNEPNEKQKTKNEGEQQNEDNQNKENSNEENKNIVEMPAFEDAPPPKGEEGNAYADGGDEEIKPEMEEKIPQGLTSEQFNALSEYLRENVGNISNDIAVQGSRAKGTAKPTSDIDIAIKVDDATFDKLINEKFGEPNSGSAKERTMQHAIETGKIQSGEAGLRNVRKGVENMLGMDADISIIKIGGQFDNPPYIPIK